MAEIPVRRSGTREMGTATSSDTLLVRSCAATLPADLRARHSSSEASPESAVRIRVARFLLKISTTLSIWKETSVSVWPSVSTKIMAVASGRSIPPCPRRTLMVFSSSTSSTLGIIPECMISVTAWPAFLRPANWASPVLKDFGFGLIFKMIPVTTPRVPSDPTKSRVRS